ncbi:bifunctional endoribonuclease/protein kinase ire1 [Conoideocrella luteorostrata]|uniref:non-specific serine/threonine protein kinase n=1 Tax=Conoideocrella luteorostrata TaxID=1105319 RepID=A0AAJ0FWL8_9HYPO|nr:bifunctional endoribonuclease/protein kinase ire1 [Conoideocrella luteorostrata]
MLRRTPIDGRGSSQQQKKLLLAFSFILLPWLQLASAQQSQQHAAQSVIPQAGDVGGGGGDGSRGNGKRIHHDPVDAVAAAAVAAGSDPIHWETTSVKPDSAEIPSNDLRRATLREQYNYLQQQQPQKSQQQQGQKQHQQQARRGSKKNPSTDHILIPNDASALATSALAPAVRATTSSRQRPSGVPASGLASPQNARSLEDWEVEDFVLLATVDGDLFANDRKTGKELWHLQVDQPMVETIHHRTSSSILDEDYSPVDHYIWAIEPTRDGGVYVWVPEPDSRPRATGFTMKELVEVLSPYAEEETSIVYVGSKRTTMITLDADTGRILKYFGPDGSHVNEAESCLKPNALFDKDSEECSSTGTITLGRTEYSVSINRRDGKTIATLKYSEWTPNNRDSDLFHQYHVSKDSRYITTQHDGKVYAFDYAKSDNIGPFFSQKFAAPVARVFDVCRPWEASAESNPDLVLLPQPAMPSQNDDMAQKRSNSIFLNRTEEGSWYALSGRAYPLIIGAPRAKASKSSWWDETASWDSLSEAKVSKDLVGTHSLATFRESRRQVPTLPDGTLAGDPDDPDNQSAVPIVKPTEMEEPTIVDKVKSLPQSAADSVVEFVRNPILIILFFVALAYNQKKLRRSYHTFRNGSSLKDTFLYLTSEVSTEEKVAVQDDSHSANPKLTELPKPATEEPSIASGSHGKDETPESDSPSGQTPKSDEDVNREADDKLKSSQSSISLPDEAKSYEGRENSATATGHAPEKRKARRGRRGGVKHRKGRPRETSQSRDDEAPDATVEEAVNNAKRLGDRPSLEPDVMTVANDMQAVTGPIIRMGNIEVNTEEQLGTGSNGTLVFAGKFDGREVAVKRMLIQFYDIASQETRLLRESDDHPNVIRYYSQQIRDGFLYIALERCAASLAEIVEGPHAFRELANAGKMDLPGVLYQITNGISHLHSLRIVHRDLKPQNILVNMGKDGRPRLLVSDFGLCKKLEGGQSSFGATTGRAAGTSGWRAPELLLDDDGRDLNLMDASTHSGSGSVLVQDGIMPHNRRATRAIDIFSLGLVFFYVLTNGSHPFDCGGRYMREVNIRKGSYNLQPLDALGDFSCEAKDLIGSMLDADPKRRPSAVEVMSHPFFWSAKKRLSFLCDVSDHFEKEPRDPPSASLAELERHGPQVTKGDFLRILPRDFVDSLGKQRKYTGSRLLDLLRALRNKRNHYEDMPDALKRQVGPLPEGYLSFWTLRFPMLLLMCWNVVYNVQWEETDRFREYYEPAGL